MRRGPQKVETISDVIVNLHRLFFKVEGMACEAPISVEAPIRFNNFDFYLLKMKVVCSSCKWTKYIYRFRTEILN
jgi:hypothetical protein